MIISGLRQVSERSAPFLNLRVMLCQKTMSFLLLALAPSCTKSLTWMPLPQLLLHSPQADLVARLQGNCTFALAAFFPENVSKGCSHSDTSQLVVRPRLCPYDHFQDIFQFTKNCRQNWHTCGYELVGLEHGCWLQPRVLRKPIQAQQITAVDWAILMQLSHANQVVCALGARTPLSL